jgi:hypothetical protein
MLYIVTDSLVIIWSRRLNIIGSDGGQRLIVVNSIDGTHWDMIPAIRCSGEARNNLLFTDPFYLSRRYVARVYRTRKACQGSCVS